MSASGQGEEQEECGFCVFMKGGGCKEPFTNWSDCVDKHREGEADFTEECKTQTIALQECMLDHKDYYKDFLAPGAGEEKAESALVGGPSQGSEEQDKSTPDKKNKAEPSSSPKSGAKDASSSKADSSQKKSDSSGQKEDSCETSTAEARPSTAEEQSDNKETQGQKEQPDDQKSSETSKSKDNKSSDDSGKESGETKGKTTSKSGTKDVAGTPAEKHAKAATETANKQERIKDQESHPVKAKPSEEKKEKADKETPEADKSKQDSAEGQDDSKDDSEDEAEEEEEEEKPEIIVQTAPADLRFVTTNQARHCYTRYQEYHKCAKEKGEDSQDCKVFQRGYRALCPGDWVDRWNEQREEGTFAGRY